MSVEVTALWTCDWCHAKGQGYGGTDSPPTDWESVDLPGVAGLHRDLCPSCSRHYREALPAFREAAMDFWRNFQGPPPKALLEAYE